MPSPIKTTDLIYRIGFVTQDDVLFPQLTVQETLVFAAFLRLPTNMSRQQKLQRAELILKELGLERSVPSNLAKVHTYRKQKKKKKKTREPA